MQLAQNVQFAHLHIIFSSLKTPSLTPISPNADKHGRGTRAIGRPSYLYFSLGCLLFCRWRTVARKHLLLRFCGKEKLSFWLKFNFVLPFAAFCIIYVYMSQTAKRIVLFLGIWRHCIFLQAALARKWLRRHLLNLRHVVHYSTCRTFSKCFLAHWQ